MFRADTSGNLEIGGSLVCSSCVSGSDVANGSLTGGDIADGSLTGSDIANSSITGSDIAANSIGETDLVNGAVGGFELDQISVVSIECDGLCNDITLGEICSVAGPNRRPVFVDCDQVRPRSSGTVSCPGGNTCYLNTILSAGDSLFAVCADQSGWDANVYCMDDDD